MSGDGVARNNMVGPVLRVGEVADAVVEALQEDNPGKEFTVEDRVAYVRAETEGECVVRAETVARVLGRPFQDRRAGGQPDFLLGSDRNHRRHHALLFPEKAIGPRGRRSRRASG